MRRAVIALVALAGLAAAGIFLVGHTRAVDDEQAAKDAERAFTTNLDKGDQKAVGGMLDRRFTWTNTEGTSRNRRDTLKDFAALVAANKGDSDVQTNFYGRVLTVRGVHNDARFLRVFVKRRHGWKAFLLLDTPMPAAGAPASVEQAAGAGDCDNPCRTVPYVPKTQMDKDILAAWQSTQMQEAGTGAPGDPVTAMRIYDFGTNTAVMTSQHTPYRGGRPYTNVRIWVLRDGRWQLALSQQVAIQSATPAPAVASKQ